MIYTISLDAKHGVALLDPLIMLRSGKHTIQVDTEVIDSLMDDLVSQGVTVLLCSEQI